MGAPKVGEQEYTWERVAGRRRQPPQQARARSKCGADGVASDKHDYRAQSSYLRPLHTVVSRLGGAWD
jgi:hypothetical protein